MWRCNDELRARADELHRLSSRKYAKYYIGMHAPFDCAHSLQKFYPYKPCLKL